MLDVLAFLAYNTTPVERLRRAEVLKQRAMKEYTAAQQEFVNYIMDLYVRNGFRGTGFGETAYAHQHEVSFTH